MQRPMRFVLRGEANPGYVTALRSLAGSLDLGSRLEILPLASADEMVRLAGEHDILLGSQPGEELFHQLAIGNKVFTGMMAGLALALSDTIAHRDLLATAPASGFLFSGTDDRAFARQLDATLSDAAHLDAMKLASWTAAERHYNWDMESRRFVSMVTDLTSRAAA